MKSTVWESPYYNFTWYSCKKSLGITGPENPCWIHVSYWKPRGYWVQVWMSNVSDKEIKKTSDFRPSSRDQMENWLYFQLLIFGGKEGDQVSGHWGLFPYCFSEFHINFWLKFQSSLLWPFQGRTTQSLQQRQWFHFCACLIPQKLLLLSSFEKQKFKVCFSVFVLKLHCFILSSKPGILLKGIFWLKRNLFLFFFLFVLPNFVPWNTWPILLAVLGAWFSLLPWLLQGHKKQQAGPCWLRVLSSPCHFGGMLETGNGTKLLLADHKLPLFCFS